MSRRLVSALLALLLLSTISGGIARAGKPGMYRYPTGGEVASMRALDVNGDGRRDLLVLLTRTGEGGGRRQELLVLVTPGQPVRGTFFDAREHRIALDAADHTRSAGALAVGRFGPQGQVRFRFIAPDGIHETDVEGNRLETRPHLAVPTLLGRNPHRAIVFWDQVADLDGDGLDEMWFPRAEGDGAIHVLAGVPSASRSLDIEAESRGSADDEYLLRRRAYVPTLCPADLDGDGRRELVAFRRGSLVAWPFATEVPAEAVTPVFDLPLPFIKQNLHPDEVHTPRLRLIDVDRDGTTDLLVTLTTGDRRQLGSFRTRLLHYPGPFRDPDTGALIAPKVRLDTESVALHANFVDLDGDGTLDYVNDSIRGNKLTLVSHVLGKTPSIWYVGFLFDRDRGTYEEAPVFSMERPYSSEETLSNRFGRTGFFAGDFDGDGRKDLLDISNLETLEILQGQRKTGGGVGDPLRFDASIQRRTRMPEVLTADAVITDLLGDGTADAVVWSKDTLYLLVTEGGS